MGLFTMHHSCVSCLLDYLKLKLDSKSRLPITEFSGYHCIMFVDLVLNSGKSVNNSYLVQSIKCFIFYLNIPCTFEPQHLLACKISLKEKLPQYYQF